jgi:hypothetical protein
MPDCAEGKRLRVKGSLKDAQKPARSVPVTVLPVLGSLAAFAQVPSSQPVVLGIDENTT